MTKNKRIPGTDEAWDAGDLGADAEHAKRAPAGTSEAIDDALGLQMISIRLPRELIEELKVIARFRGVGGYQPLIRDVLKRFANAELKQIGIEYANQKSAQAKQAKTDPCDEPPIEHKKAA